MKSDIENIKEYVDSLGGLHDVTITKMLWSPEIDQLELEVKDIEWGIEGFPGYKGPTPTRIVFSGVKEFSLNISKTPTDEHNAMLYGWEFLENSEYKFMNKFSFSPGGEMLFGCNKIEFIKL